MISPTTLAWGLSLPSTATSNSSALAFLPPTPCSTTSLRSYFAARSSAGRNSLRLCALEMPTDEPRLAGFTKTGYLSAASTCAMAFRGARSHSARSSVTCLTMGNLAWAKSRFITSLSMPAAEPSTPEPT